MRKNLLNRLPQLAPLDDGAQHPINALAWLKMWERLTNQQACP